MSNDRRQSTYGWDIKFSDGQTYRVESISNVLWAIDIAVMNTKMMTPRKRPPETLPRPADSYDVREAKYYEVSNG